jgi:hypothetical protein
VVFGIIGAVTLLLAGMFAWDAEALLLSHRRSLDLLSTSLGLLLLMANCCKLYGKWHCPSSATTLAVMASRRCQITRTRSLDALDSSAWTNWLPQRNRNGCLACRAEQCRQAPHRNHAANDKARELGWIV